MAPCEVLDKLTTLVEKSLVVAEPAGDGTRYRLLETVRQYAAERVPEDEGTTLRTRHLAQFTALAEEAERHFRGAQQDAWFRRLTLDDDNLRAALAWASEADADTGLRLATALGRFWYIRAHFQEGRAALTTMLTLTAGAPPSAVRALALDFAGAIASREGDYSAASAMHAESLSIGRLIEEPRVVATALINLGLVHFEEGDLPNARKLLEESIALMREIGHRTGLFMALTNIGGVSFDEGDYVAAREFMESALEIAREMGDGWGIALSLDNLGLVAYEFGQMNEAHGLQRDSLMMRVDLGDRRGIAESIEGLAQVEAACGQPLSAARLWGAGERLREEIGAPRPPNERHRYDARVAAARQAAGESDFDSAWQQGADLPLDDAVALAMR